VRLKAFKLTDFLERRRFLRELIAIPPLLAQDLEIMASALRAGSSFTQAMQIAADDSGGLMAEEWRAVMREIQMGVPLAQALHHLEERRPCAEIRSLVTIVSILQETGGNMAGVFLTLAGTVRQEIAFQGKLRAMTAQGRLSGYLMSAIPFVILFALGLLTPDLIKPLFVTAVGWCMLAVVVVMVTMGSWMIKKIVTIEV
jgi:tight adherence protein B